MTSLRSLIKENRLKTPVQLGFRMAAWDGALESIDCPTSEDTSLYESVRFFGRQLQGLRDLVEQFPPPAGSLDSQLRRAIGAANRDTLTALAKLNVTSENGNVWAHEMLQQEMTLATGTKLRPFDLIQSIIDSLRYELGYLSRVHNGETLEGIEGINRIIERHNLAGFYHMLNEEWLDCLHHGWSLRTEDQVTYIGPFMNELNAANRVIGEAREDMLVSELSHRAQLRFDEKTFQSPGVVEEPAGSMRYRCLATSGIEREVFTSIVLMNEPDLTPFLNEAIDSSGLTLLQMAHIWFSFVPLAYQLQNQLRIDECVTSLVQVEALSPLINIHSLARALAQCNQLDIVKCEAAINLLVWRNSRDDLWHRPLVLLEDGLTAVPIILAITSPNLRRSLEYWLAEGGVDLSARGSNYEEYVRSELVSGIERNERLTNAGALPYALQPEDDSVGDIDLVAWVGNSFLVGEIKCSFRPATSHDWFKHEDRLREGVEQAKRKARWLEEHPELLEAVLGRSIETNSNYIPCVIVNAPMGALRAISGVPIVDFYILQRFFVLGYTTGAVSLEQEATAERIWLYDSSEEAAKALASYLRYPKHLAIYLNPSAIQWNPMPQPDFADHTRTIVRLAPKLILGRPVEEP